MRRQATESDGLMPRNKDLKFNKRGWDEIAQHVIRTDGRRRMQRVADAANAQLSAPGFKVSDEGDEPLSKRDYSATVITTTPEAMRHNAKHNTLVKALPLAGGE